MVHFNCLGFLLSNIVVVSWEEGLSLSIIINFYNKSIKNIDGTLTDITILVQIETENNTH